MPPRSAFQFDEASGRYKHRRTGRYVSRADIRAEIDRVLLDAEKDARSLGEQLRTKKITRPVWEREMKRLVKDVHLLSGAAAKGGRAYMSPSDFGRVGQAVRRQYRYLEKFSADIKRGLALDGRFSARAQLYAQSGRSTFHTTERREMQRRGLSEERSVLHPAEHCEQCVEEAAAGWRAVGEMVPIGARTCMSRCKCSVSYRRSAA